MNTSENNAFSTVYGVVMEEQTLVKTQVHGDISTSSRGYVSGSIGSTTREEQQFWVRKDDGQEIHVDIRSIRGTLPVRKGHNVILAYFENRKMPSALYIQDTKQPYVITHAHEEAKLGTKQKILCTIFILALTFEVFGMGSVPIFSVVALCLLWAYLWRKRYLKNKQRQQIEKKIADDALQYIYRDMETKINKS